MRTKRYVVSVKLEDKPSPDEISTSLGKFGKYEVIKLIGGEILSLHEFTDNIFEISGRLDYLNNRSWKAIYMARKKIP